MTELAMTMEQINTDYINQLIESSKRKKARSHEQAIWVQNERRRIANTIKGVLVAIMLFAAMGVVGRMDYESEIGVKETEVIIFSELTQR